MHFDLNGEDHISIEKFESMLRSNEVIFFDSNEFEQIIEHYLEEGKMIIARKAIKLGMTQHPGSIPIKLLYAEILVFDNNFDKAQEVLNDIQEIEPRNEEVYIQKASIYSKTEDHVKAIHLLEIALDYTPDTADVYNLLGMEYLFLEDFENAKTHFMKCLEEDEMDYAALYNIIYCFEYLKQHTQAIEYLNAYLDTNPYCEVAWHQLGKQYYELKEYDKALAAYDFAIISDDYFVGAYLEKGKVLERLGRFNEAIENYKITFKLDDPTSFAYLRTGKCYLKLGVDEQALHYFKKTVKEDPLLDKGWRAIIDYYLKKLDYQKALSFVEKAIDIDHENSMYWIRFAKINRRLGFFEESEYGYRRAIELGNYELETWLSRADLLHEIGEYAAAVINIKQGLEFYPEDPELEYRLAGLFYVQGETVSAEFHLQNAFKTDPEFKIIIEELFPDLLLRPRIKSLLEGGS